MTGPILAAPVFGGGRGGGHLTRSAALVRELRALGREAYIFLPGGSPDEKLRTLLDGMDAAWILTAETEPVRRSWEWIILDRFQTTEAELRRWAALAPVIGIDEGGPARAAFDFLIDILPALPGVHPPNITLWGKEGGVPPCGRAKVPAYPSYGGAAPVTPPPGGLEPPGPPFENVSAEKCRGVSGQCAFITEPPGSRSEPYGNPQQQRPEPAGFPRNSEAHPWCAGPPFENAPADRCRGVSGQCASTTESPGSGPVPGRNGRPFNILISFGAEDSAGLTIPAALAALSACDRPLKVSALFGPLNNTPPGEREALEQAGVRILAPLPSLAETLSAYDLVITHFGVTAFEALHAGAQVILVSPSRLHERLARNAGFTSAGIGPAACRRLVNKLNKLGGRREEGGVGEAAVLRFSAARLIAEYTPLVPTACPVCGGSGGRLEDPVAARFPERSYRRCRRCSTVYQERTAPPPIEYAAGYFFDSYKKQYGKTYLEDFPALKKAGEARLRRIRRLLAQGGVCPRALPERLLDVGCAFGPFLAAAAEAGFDPLGIDPSEEAAAYVRDTLRIPVRRGVFPDAALGEGGLEPGFAVITLWYVIEHFRAPGEVLAAIYRLLRPGGVLAFSTPSFSGVSGRKSPLDFLRASPADHWTVWDPRRARRVLDDAGFTVKEIVITGRHPERFPVIGGLLEGRRGPVYRALMALSRIFGLGDTFEVYAVKNTKTPPAHEGHKGA